MILVDMNQISLASVMMHLHMTKNTEPDDNMVRHMILNSLRMYRTRFSSEYGELVLCYDSKHTGGVTFFHNTRLVGAPRESRMVRIGIAFSSA